jgi:phosphatidylinositol-3,4,5-trisphosphate 3-phosphatase/dual-specificity protein phosphatase PTEN
MNWLRCKVSGKRNRFKDDNYNLDITYITDRVLAMSFPASGFEQCYRNNIARVANFLQEKHGDNYKIFNLSNRSYNEERFRGKVRSYDWEDHHPPALCLLFQLCFDMYEYLMDPNNVVVIHCNAGKGRTGTSIA